MSAADQEGTMGARPSRSGRVLHWSASGIIILDEIQVCNARSKINDSGMAKPSHPLLNAPRQQKSGVQNLFHRKITHWPQLHHARFPRHQERFIISNLDCIEVVNEEWERLAKMMLHIRWGDMESVIKNKNRILAKRLVSYEESELPPAGSQEFDVLRVQYYNKNIPWFHCNSPRSPNSQNQNLFFIFILYEAFNNSVIVFAFIFSSLPHQQCANHFLNMKDLHFHYV